jgi:prophage regulatory protein
VRGKLASDPRLAGVAEVAALKGVSRQRGGRITKHPDFPEPYQVLAMGPVWVEADVIEYLATPRKAGRRPKNQQATKTEASE